MNRAEYEHIKEQEKQIRLLKADIARDLAKLILPVSQRTDSRKEIIDHLEQGLAGYMELSEEFEALFD